MTQTRLDWEDQIEENEYLYFCTESVSKISDQPVS
jgi:hypothetical protein